MEEHHKIYCLIFFPHLRKAIALDREYSFMTDDRAVWGKIKIEDIVESDTEFYAGQNLPDWSNELAAAGHPYAVMWTDYYERVN